MITLKEDFNLKRTLPYSRPPDELGVKIKFSGWTWDMVQHKQVLT